VLLAWWFAFSVPRIRHARCMTCGAWAPMPEAGPLFSVEMKRRTTTGGGSPLVWRFASFALGDQRTSCMTCGTGPPCHRLGTLVCIGGDFPWRFGARAGESAFKKGFIPRAAAMPCFSPTRCALSPPSSLRPFAFKVSALHRHSFPWPCKFIPSVPRLSGCSTWCAACLDGMRRRSAEGFASTPSSSANLPLESSCSLSSTSPAGWCCRSCLSSAGGAWPRGAALFHRCLASRMFISLAVVESKLGYGSVFHVSW
jgi:hypothetical protein